MRGMKTARALGEIDEQFITEAAPEKVITVKVFPWKYVALASSIALVICIGMMVVMFGGSRFDYQTASDSTSSEVREQWEKKEVDRNPDDSENADTEAKYWSQMTLPEKYPDFSFYAEYDFQATNGTIDKSLLGDKIDIAYSPLTFNKNGSDFILNPNRAIPDDPFDHSARYKKVELYNIKNFPIAMAVKFLTDETTKDDPEYDKYYVYINVKNSILSLYSLINLIDNKIGNDFNLSFGSAYYYTDDGRTIEFENLDKDKIIELLTSDKETGQIVENSEEILLKGNYKKRLSISTNVEVLGLKNKSITVSDDGYVVTNILNYAQVFNIGKQRAQELIDYIKNNCKGYELVYKNSGSDSSASSSGKDDSSSTAATLVDPSNVIKVNTGKIEMHQIKERTWEEKSMCERFDKIGDLTAVGITVPEKRVNFEPAYGLLNAFGETTATDPATNKTYTANYLAYSIKDTNLNYIQAIKFKDTSEYYVYIKQNSDPKLLGDLIKGLDLEHNLSFLAAKNTSSSGKEINYSISNSRKAYEILFTNVINAKAVDDPEKMYFDGTFKPSYEIDTLSELFSETEVVATQDGKSEILQTSSKIKLSDDGYLCMDILGRKLIFEIGKEAVQNFQVFLITNCKTMTY